MVDQPTHHRADVGQDRGAFLMRHRAAFRRASANELHRRGMSSATGKQWHALSTHRARRRVGRVSPVTVVAETRRYFPSTSRKRSRCEKTADQASPLLIAYVGPYGGTNHEDHE